VTRGLLAPPPLTRLQRLVLRVRGRVKVGEYTRPGWKGYLPLYAARCGEHGLFLDTPHGWRGELECPRCFEDRLLAEAIAELVGAGG